MLKIIEIRETLYDDSSLIDNLYKINKLTSKIISEAEVTLDLNKDDYQYLDVVLEKTKTNLLKVYNVVKL